MIISVTKVAQLEHLADQGRNAHCYSDGDHRQPYGHAHGDEGAEEHYQDDQSDRDADPLSPPQIALGDLGVLVSDAGLADHQHAVALLVVCFPDDLQNALDVIHRLREVGGQEQGKCRSPAVGGHPDIGHHRGHVAPQGRDLREGVIDLGLELWCIDGHRIRLDDQDLGRRFRPPELLLQQPVGAGRFSVLSTGDLGGGGRVEGVYRVVSGDELPVDGQETSDDEQEQPGAYDEPGAAG